MFPTEEFQSLHINEKQKNREDIHGHLWISMDIHGRPGITWINMYLQARTDFAHTLKLIKTGESDTRRRRKPVFNQHSEFQKKKRTMHRYPEIYPLMLLSDHTWLSTPPRHNSHPLPPSTVCPAPNRSPSPVRMRR